MLGKILETAYNLTGTVITVAADAIGVVVREATKTEEEKKREEEEAERRKMPSNPHSRDRDEYRGF